MADKLQQALEQIYEKADNALHSLNLPVSPAIHVAGLKGIVADIKLIAAGALPETSEVLITAKLLKD